MDSDGDAGNLTSFSNDSIKVSEYGSQFIPKEGDEENLWEVIEILKENGNRYLIRWAGVDDRGKPWKNSWVRKGDVTDDVISDWKFKKAKRKKEKQDKKKGKRSSDQVSYRGRRASVVSSKSTAKPSTRASKSIPPDSATTHRSIPSPLPTTKKRKRGAPAERAHHDSGAERHSTTSPRKRRKVVEVEIISSRLNSRGQKSKNKRVKILPDEDGVVEEGNDAGSLGLKSLEPSRRYVREEEEEEEEEEGFLREEEEEPIEQEPRDDLDIYDQIPVPASQRRPRTENEPSARPLAPDRESTPSNRRSQPPRPRRRLSHDNEEEEMRETATYSTESERREANTDKMPGKRITEKTPNASTVDRVKNSTLKFNLARKSIERHSDSSSDAGPLKQLLSKQIGKKRAKGTKLNRAKQRDRVDAQRSSMTPETDNDNVPRPLSPSVSISSLHGSPSRPHRPHHQDSPAANEDTTMSHNGDHGGDDAGNLDQSCIDNEDHIVGINNQLADGGLAEEPESDRHSAATKNVESADVEAADKSWAGTVIPETQSSTHTDTTSDSSQLVLASSPPKPPPRVQQEEHSPPPKPKPLKPIPHVTPTIFHEHLRAIKPLPPVSPSAFHQHLPGHEPEMPPSPIETNFSPIKAAQNTALPLDVDMSPLEAGGDDSNDEDHAIRSKGMKLAEAHTARTRRTLYPPQARKSLKSLSTRPSTSGALADAVKEPEQNHVGLNSGADAGGDDGHGRRDALARKEHQEGEGSLRGCEREVDQMDEADVDSSLVLNVSNVDRDVDIGHDVDDDESPHYDTTTRSSTPFSSPRDEDFLVTAIPRTPSKISLSNLHNIQTPTRQLDAALGLLNTKSEEISDLKTQIHNGEDHRKKLQERIVQLEADNEWLSRAPHGDAISHTKQDIGDACLRQENEEAWAKERKSFLTEIKLFKDSKANLEDDRNFFREQYGIASAFTTRVQQENQDLQSRVSIAEQQVTAGLQLIRTTYEVRLQKLEEELKKSKGLLKVFREKDHRTDDAVRMRAALEPELRVEVDKLREDSRALKAELDLVLKERNALLVEKIEIHSDIDDLRRADIRMQKECRRLRVELARFTARERAVMKCINKVDTDAEGEPEDREEEDVFMCAWLTSDDGVKCGQLFVDRQDLQDHLYVAGHV